MKRVIHILWLYIPDILWFYDLMLRLVTPSVQEIQRQPESDHANFGFNGSSWFGRAHVAE